MLHATSPFIEENAQLAAFLGFEGVPPSPFPTTEATERGRLIFESMGCASCHTGSAFTDGASHDVGTGDGTDEQFGPEFDTPTLLGLWDSSPYLHHGRAATLHDVFSGGHGESHALADRVEDAALDDLVAYLLSLPASD